MILRVIFLMFLLFFYSCRNKYSNEDLAIFRYNESSGINTLDPAFAKDQATIWVANQLFNGLVQLDTSLNIKPSISNSWILSSDAIKGLGFVPNYQALDIWNDLEKKYRDED